MLKIKLNIKLFIYLFLEQTTIQIWGKIIWRQMDVIERRHTHNEALKMSALRWMEFSCHTNYYLSYFLNLPYRVEKEESGIKRNRAAGYLKELNKTSVRYENFLDSIIFNIYDFG